MPETKIEITRFQPVRREAWWEKRPGLVGWIITGAIVGAILIAAKACS